MIAVLLFKLPDEEGEFEKASHAAKAYRVLEKMDYELREKIHNSTNSTSDTMNELRKFLWDACGEEGIDIGS